MKYLFIVAATLLISNRTWSQRSTNSFAVLELFTSEGCSSCPLAETAADELQKQYGNSIYVLEFHVDYWDRLGWKDNFSDHNYTLRQQRYVKSLHVGSAYTPQAIINGKYELVGSNKKQLQELISKELISGPAGNLFATAAVTGNIIRLHYDAPVTDKQVLNIALVQRAAEINVTNGENKGRKLRHNNIVRSFTTINRPANTGECQISIPAGLSAKNCSIIAFTQSDDGTVTSAKQVEL